MSKEVIRAYRQFQKMEQKMANKNKDKMAASSGLLSPRSPRNTDSGQKDQFTFLHNIVSEIRKYGGKKNG